MCLAEHLSIHLRFNYSYIFWVWVGRVFMALDESFSLQWLFLGVTFFVTAGSLAEKQAQKTLYRWTQELTVLFSAEELHVFKAILNDVVNWHKSVLGLEGAVLVLCLLWQLKTRSYLKKKQPVPCLG